MSEKTLPSNRGECLTRFWRKVIEVACGRVNFHTYLPSSPFLSSKEDSKYNLICPGQLIPAYGSIVQCVAAMLSNAVQESTEMKSMVQIRSQKHNVRHCRKSNGVCVCVCVAVSETALAEPALNILCLLMMGQWSWLCTENIQRTIRILFGTVIDRWAAHHQSFSVV